MRRTTIQDRSAPVHHAYAVLISLTVLLMPEVGAAQTTYGGEMCGSSVPTVIDVWWSPDGLAAAGFDVDRFRETVIRVIATWNEESRTGRAGIALGAHG